MYSRYQNYLRTLTTGNEPFKRHPDYTYMLEHVSKPLGDEYVALLRSEFNMSVEQIVAFCLLNDSIGSPNTVPINGLPSHVSPTSLRYLYHAHHIIRHMKDTDTYVELGCGYGGLCMALNFLGAPIRNYHIVDVDEAIPLIQKVLAMTPPRFAVHFHSASTYGSGIQGPFGLISNYCFSEIESYHQQRYVETVFPRATCGFITWNHVPLFPIGHEITAVTERPLTGPGNMFVTFG
jgi:hypothetical protein